LRGEIARRAVLLGGGAALAGCGSDLKLGRPVSFTVVGTRVMLRGEVTRRTPAQFAAMMGQNPQITTVVLQNIQTVRDGVAALELGYAIRGRGLGTALQSDSVVHGDAVLLFLAGVERRMVEGSQIGLRGMAQDAARARYVADMLGTQRFYRFALRKGVADGIYILTEEEVARFGILSEPVRRFE